MFYSLGIFLIGVLAGVLSGAFGIGGATITTPLLRDILHTSGYIALGTPLPLAFFMASSGAWAYHRSGMINLRVAAWCGMSGSIAAVLLAATTQYFSGRSLMLITSVYIAAVGVKFWKGEVNQPRTTTRGIIPLILIGVASGAISGFLGVGGGIVLVPALVLVIGFPVQQAIGTSLLSMAVYSIPGSVVHWLLGHIDFTLLPLLVPGSLLGAQVGARLAIRAQESSLRAFFTAYLFLVGAVMAIFEIFHFT